MYASFSNLGVDENQNKDMYSVVEIQDMNHKKDILSSNAIVCIDIYATWCQPCKATEPEYAMLAKEYNRAGVCAVVKELFDKKLTMPLPQGLPTYQFFFKGKKVSEDVIGADINKVKQTLEKLIQQYQSSQNFQNNYPATYNNTPVTAQGPQANRNSIRSYRNTDSFSEYNNHAN